MSGQPKHTAVLVPSPGPPPAGALDPMWGMALEPRTAALAEEEGPELADMRRRFWGRMALTLPVVVIAMPHRVTMPNTRRSLFFAFVYNALGVPAAADFLYPILGLLLPPVMAAAATSLSSVSVNGNALRLRRVRP